MAKKSGNKNASPKIGKAQNGVSKNKGKTPDKKKLKEAAVKTPTTVTALTPKAGGKKSKQVEKKTKDDYVTLELGDSKRPKVGKLTKAEKRKLKRARKQEEQKKKDESKDVDSDEDEEVSEVVIESDKEEKDEEKESDDDSEEESDDASEEEEQEAEAKVVGEEEEESDDSEKEDDDSKYEEETDSDSEPVEVKTEIKKKGVPNKEIKDKKKKEKKEKNEEAVKTDTGFTVSFRGFDIGTEEEIINNFIHSAVDPEEIAHTFLARKRNKKIRGFGFITLKTEEACEKLLKLNETEVEGKTIQVGKATFEPKGPKKETEKRKREDDEKNEPLTKKKRNQFAKSDEVTLCVKNIDFNATDDQIREYFETAVSKDEIKQIRAPKKPEGGGRGFAFIEFASQEALEKAKELDGSEFNGRKLVVQLSLPKEAAKRNSNDFNKFKGDRKDFRQNKNFGNDRRPPFNKNKKFDGRNKNFQNNKGKFGRESKGKGNHFAKQNNS